MKPHSRAPEQDDLLRPRLVDMIDAHHELVKLAALTNLTRFPSGGLLNRAGFAGGSNS